MKLKLKLTFVALLAFFSMRGSVTTGRGLNFDGSDDYISFTQNLSTVTNFTYEAWVNVHANNAWARILDFGNSAGVNIFLTTSQSGTGQPRFAINLGSGEQFVTAPSALPLNTWTHIALTLGGNTATMYINGTQVAQNTSFTYTPSSLGATTKNYIGKSQYNDPYFNGDLDEVRIWNVTRTQAQISANMNCDVALQTGLIAYYRFDEGAAAGNNLGIGKVYDYTGNTRCGTFNSFSRTGTSSNYVTGYLSSCNTIDVPAAAAITGTAVVCAGSNITLSNTTSGGTWSSANTAVGTVNSSTGVVRGIAAGTATISYSVTNTCYTSVATMVVTVSALANAGTLSGTGTICVGATATLSSSSSGGVWSSSNTAAGTINSSTGVVGGIAAGTTNITYTVTNSCNTATAVKTVTVNPLASAGAISGSAAVCEAATSTFTTTGTGGAWSTSNVGVATVGTSGIVTGVAAGNAIISYTATNSCNTSIATKAVTVNPLAVAGTVSGAGTVCEAATITLSSTAGGGVWSSSNTAAAAVGSTTGIVSGLSAGVTTISYTVSNSCNTATALNTITVNPLASAGAISGSAAVCEAATSTFTTTGTGGAWSTSNVGVATVSTSGIVSGVSAGNATISYTATNSCNTSIATMEVTVNPIVDAGAISGTTIFCEATTHTFSSSATGGVWSSSDTGVATVNTDGLVTGIAGGNVLISYTVTGSCNTAAATIAVTINPVADAGIIGGNVPVCKGDSLTLTETVTGGEWSSLNTNVATVSASGIVSTIAAGTVEIAYTLNCSATSAIVSVNTAPATGGNIYTIAGTGDATYNGDGAQALQTAMAYPISVAMDKAGNKYVAQLLDGRIRKIDPSGIVSTVAGTGVSGYNGDDIPATDAQLLQPSCVRLDNAGNMYVVENAGQRIRKINTAGIISTIAGNGLYGYSGDGGPATDASIRGVIGMTIGADNNVYFGDFNNHCIRKVDSSGIITTVAGMPESGGYDGDGVATAVKLNGPAYMAVDDSGNIVFADVHNMRVRKLTPGGMIVTIAGNGSPVFSGDGGSALDAGFYVPVSVALYNGNIFVAENSGNRIRKINSSGIVTTIAGTGTTGSTGDGGPATAAELYNPYDLTVDEAGSIYIGEPQSNKVRRIYGVDMISGARTICAGATAAQLSSDYGGVWSSGNTSVATVGSTGIVTGVAGGVVAISYTVANACGSKYIIAQVTVNGGPAAITGAATVLTSSTTTYASATSGGMWSSSDSSKLSINATTGTANALATGVVTIIYTITGGCGGSVTKMVTVNGAPVAPITGTMAICVGGTSVLSDASAPGLSWTSSNTAVATVGSASGLVTALSAGTATITFTGSTGGTATAVVTVNAVPAAITGVPVACPGSTTIFSSTTAGGTWSSSNLAKASVGSTNGVITGIASGTSIITYTLATGCKAIAVVTINTAPAAITGATAVCTGATSALADATAGGNWSSNDPSIASVSTTGVVTGNGTGSTNINYALGSGCSAFVTVTVGAISAITGNTNMCLGTSTTLAHATTGGMWNSGNTAVATVSGTGVVTGVATGTANITYTLGGGCRTAATVTVNATLPNIAGPTSVCINSTVTLTNTTTGGTWTTTGSNASVDASTGVVTGMIAGTATITYSVATGCSKTYVVTVKPLPTAISGAGSVCVGATTTMTDATSGGLSWTSSTPANATINASGVVTGIAAGTTTITYTLTSGCITTKDVTINAIPATITGVTNVCAGATTTLSSASTGGTWVSNNTAIATIGSASGVVTGVAASITTVTYSLDGCRAVTNVTVNALPAAVGGAMGVCTGGTTTLSSATTGGTWSSSNTAVATVGTTGLVTGVGAGNATISYTMATGCARTAVVTISALPVITGTTTICSGSSVTLGASAAGGTWTSSATGVATIGASTGVLNGMANGTTNITYAISASCKGTAVVTVGSGPAAIAGASAVCLGATTTLTDATSGGTWSSANTAIAAVDPSTGVVSGTGSGSATITYTVAAGCYVVRGITVGSGTATVSGNGGICIGATTVLTASATGSAWTSGNTAVATIGSSSGVVTGIAAGTAIITYAGTGSGAGCLTLKVMTVDAVPAVAAITGPSSVIIGHSVTLADATPSGTWSASNAGATVTSGGVVTGVSGSAVTISYTVANGVCRASATKYMTITASRTAMAATVQAIDVYPNPTKGTFTIASPAAGTCAIFTLEGKALMTIAVSAGDNLVQLPQGIAVGIYMCHISCEDGSTTMVRLVYEQ